jgi:hypothetical protein
MPLLTPSRIYALSLMPGTRFLKWRDDRYDTRERLYYHIMITNTGKCISVRAWDVVHVETLGPIEIANRYPESSAVWKRVTREQFLDLMGDMPDGSDLTPEQRRSRLHTKHKLGVPKGKLP